MGKGAKALPKGSKKTASKTTLSKGVAKKPAFKVALKASNLAKLGKIRLAEKIKKATEGAETAEEAAQAKKGGMNKGDHSVAWSRRKTWLKGQGKEAQNYNGLSKTKKGEAVALWLVKSQGPKFQAWTEDVKATKSLEKSEKWKSEKQMLEEHGGEGIPGLMESTTTWTMGMPPKEARWQRARSTKEGKSMPQMRKMSSSGKPLPKTICTLPSQSSRKEKARAKAKTRVKGSATVLALTNGHEEDPAEEEEESKENFAKCLTKAKSCRDLLSRTCLNG